MAIKISVVAQKGGTSKTTTCEVLGSIFSKKGKVLLVDLDGQASLTQILTRKEPKHNLLDVLIGEIKPQDAILHLEHYDLIAGGGKLYNVEGVECDFTELREEIQKIERHYDFIIYDTPPSLGNLQKLGIVASDYVLLSAIPSIQFYNIFENVIATVKSMKKKNSKMQFLGAIMTKYDRRKSANREIASLIDEKCKENGFEILKPEIRSAVAVEEAQALCKSLMDYAPHSTVFMDYEALANNIFEKLGV